MIRQRLSKEIYQAIFDMILEGLRAHGLLRGRNLGIDSSVIEANASLRALQNRNTGEAYWDYVRRLAAEAGVDPEDVSAVRRFDKQRPGRKTSNQEWVNPYDSDAKVAKAKDGATDMLYKPENVVDLDTGAILGAEVRRADEADTEGLAERALSAAALVEAIREETSAAAQKPVPAVTATLTADSRAERDRQKAQPFARRAAPAGAGNGYYCVAELEAIQESGIKTVISDPLRNRRVDQLIPEQRAVVRRARRSAKSGYGKALLRRRGMHIERSFAHLLDSGGMRRATLRGQHNLEKRYKIAAATYNLSQLLRHRFGIGTPKQAAARVGRAFRALFTAFKLLTSAFRAFARLIRPLAEHHAIIFCGAFAHLMRREKGAFSTGC